MAKPSARPAQRPRLRILLGAAIAIGPGKADLLDAIDRCGSISGAARALGMSYRRAWQLTNVMNHAFREQVVAAGSGGARGGGARLTPFGREVLDRYRAMEAKAARSVAADMRRFQRLLADDPAN